MSIFQKAMIAATANPVIEKLVTGTDPGRSLAHRFVAGEALEEAAGVAAEINRRGMPVSLDLLGEEVHDPATAQAALNGYLACLDRIKSDSLAANVSIKLTQLGLAFDRSRAVEALDQLALAAAEGGTTVTIDMEDSRFTAATIELYAEAITRHQNLGVCLQAYCQRSADDLERLIPLGGHIRLCKGAYVEDDVVAFQDRNDVDASFLRLLEVLMADPGVTPAVATHDDRMIARAIDLAADRSAPWEFQMLYGVRPDLQTSLVADGNPVRVYLPYGSQWYAYLTRRLAERPANMTFFLRALLGG